MRTLAEIESDLAVTRKASAALSADADRLFESGRIDEAEAAESQRESRLSRIDSLENERRVVMYEMASGMLDIGAFAKRFQAVNVPGIGPVVADTKSRVIVEHGMSRTIEHAHERAVEMSMYVRNRDAAEARFQRSNRWTGNHH